jgi:phosphate transport system protein
MLRDALDAFVNSNVEVADKVLHGDDAVDDLYGKALREMMAFMVANPAKIPAAMGVANVAKYLERIADHATNIAEGVIFTVAGSDVRHHARTNPPPPVQSSDGDTKR